MEEPNAALLAILIHVLSIECYRLVVLEDTIHEHSTFQRNQYNRQEEKRWEQRACINAHIHSKPEF